MDDGNPIKKVPHRDAVWAMEAGNSDPAKEVVRIQHRLTGIDWLPTPDQVLVTEYDRDRRWSVTAQLDLSHPAESRKVLFDRSAQDDYHDPGNPLTRMRPDGQVVVVRDGDYEMAVVAHGIHGLIERAPAAEPMRSADTPDFVREEFEWHGGRVAVLDISRLVAAATRLSGMASPEEDMFP